MSFIRTDWDYAKLEELIQARGDDVIIETGIACSCRRNDSIASLTTKESQPTTLRELNCSICQGDGYIYRNGRCIKGLLTSVQAGPNRKLLEGGYAVIGDAVFSPSLKAGHIGDFDRITLTVSDSVGDGQNILRNAAYLYESATKDIGVEPNEDRLWYMADCALWCEDENGVVYTQNSDFILEDKLIRWLANKPDDGVFYTLKYTAYLEWIVYNTPLLRVDSGTSLAQKVLIRKKHVAFGSGSKADTPAKRQAEEGTFTTRVKI